MNLKSTIDLPSGNRMPVLGLGTWQMRGSECIRATSTALNLGYRLIDTSGNYGNHRQIGEAISSSGIPRNGIFVVSKIENYDNAYEATKFFLHELQLDYLNLVLI